MAVGADDGVEGLAVAVALEGQLADGPIFRLFLLGFLEEEDELVDDLKFGFGVGHKQPQVLLDYFIDIVARVELAEHLVGHCDQLSPAGFEHCQRLLQDGADALLEHRGKHINCLLEDVERVDQQTRVLVIDLLDGHREVPPDVEVGLEFLGVLEGELEEVVEQLDAVLPVLLERVALVELLKLGVVGGEVLAGHDLAEDDLLELVVLYLDPQVVLPLLVEVLQQLINALQLLLLQLNDIVLPVLVALQDELYQSLALASEVELRLLVELRQHAPDPLELLPVDLLRPHHALHVQQEGELDIAGAGVAHRPQRLHHLGQVQLLNRGGDAPLDLVLHELGGGDGLLEDGHHDGLRERVHAPVQLPHHLVHAHQGQFGHPRAQVADALQQLAHQVGERVLGQQLGVKLDDGSDLVDGLELDAPVAVLYLQQCALQLTLGVL